MSGASTTRRFTFAAGHRYEVGSWSPEENQRRFGRLTVPHGHNYTLDVTVRGAIDPRTGMVIDLGELKRVVQEAVIERFDHAELNADPLLRDRVQADENIELAWWEWVGPTLTRARVCTRDEVGT